MITLHSVFAGKEIHVRAEAIILVEATDAGSWIRVAGTKKPFDVTESAEEVLEEISMSAMRGGRARGQ